MKMIRFIGTKEKKIATILLAIMCVQFIAIEGQAVSNLKFAVMVITPLFWLTMTRKVSNAFIWGGLYLLVILVSIIYNIDSFRLSTVGYKMSFFFMFIFYYNLIYKEHAFSAEYFIKMLKTLILAYAIVLLVQQVAIVIGIRRLPIINLMYYLNRGIGSNSLGIEPSHSARLMTALFLCLLRMYEIQWGIVTIPRLYKEDKWVVIGFLWSMLTMGSGTAFVGLALLTIYFLKKQYILTIIPVLIILYLVIPLIMFEPLLRVRATVEAAMTLDQETIIDADYSAAARIVPFINTFTNLDVSNLDTWLGKGIDVSASAAYLSEEQTVGGVGDYGLISYILSFIFVFKCCFRKLLSVETLIYIVLLGGAIYNIAYLWAILMLFATTKYFAQSGRRLNLPFSIVQ